MYPGKVRHYILEIATPGKRKVGNFAGADLVARDRSRLIDGRRRARYIDRLSNLLFMLEVDIEIFGLSYLHALQLEGVKPLLFHTYLIKARRNASHCDSPREIRFPSSDQARASCVGR